MKNKLLTTLLSLILLLSLLPMSALAALPEGVPTSLETPTIKSIELKHNDDGIPYFEAQVYFPQSVLDLDSEAPGGGSVFWDYSVKVDNGSWGEFGGGGYINVYTGGEDGEALPVGRCGRAHSDSRSPESLLLLYIQFALRVLQERSCRSPPQHAFYPEQYENFNAWYYK